MPMSCSDKTMKLSMSRRHPNTRTRGPSFAGTNLRKTRLRGSESSDQPCLSPWSAEAGETAPANMTNMAAVIASSQRRNERLGIGLLLFRGSIGEDHSGGNGTILQPRCSWCAHALQFSLNGRYGMSGHSGLMLAARITLLHFSVSLTMKASKSTEEPANIALPRSERRACTWGSARIALIALLSLSTIDPGVLLRRPMAHHWLAS